MEVCRVLGKSQNVKVNMTTSVSLILKPWLTSMVSVVIVPATFPSAVSYVCPPQVIPSVAFADLCTIPQIIVISIPQGRFKQWASHGTASRLAVTAVGCCPYPDKSRSMCTEPRVPDVNASRLMNTARASTVSSKNA